jgi:hypothetical protein
MDSTVYRHAQGNLRMTKSQRESRDINIGDRFTVDVEFERGHYRVDAEVASAPANAVDRMNAEGYATLDAGSHSFPVRIDAIPRAL